MAWQGSGIIVRADAHASYPPGFVESVARTLEETAAASVVVRLRTMPGNCFQTAVAAVANAVRVLRLSTAWIRTAVGVRRGP